MSSTQGRSGQRKARSKGPSTKKSRVCTHEVGQFDRFMQVAIGLSGPDKPQIERERTLEQDGIRREVADAPAKIF
jgi:hypothetical protein